MTTPFDLSTFLPYQLAFLSERVSGELSVEYGRSHGLSMPEWRVLVHLQRVGTASVRDIQGYTNLEKSRVSRVVVRLIQKGWVFKDVGKEDSRLVEIGLTELGTETIESVLPMAAQFEEKLLKGLSKAQLKQFFEVVDHLHKALEE